jgi:hypothetical protein
MTLRGRSDYISLYCEQIDGMVEPERVDRLICHARHNQSASSSASN